VDAAIRLLNTLLPMLYALAVVAYAVDFFREDPFAARAARVLMEVILGLHALFIGLRTALYEHLPLASAAELMTMLALALAIVYLFVEWRSRVRKTGMFLISFSFVLQTLSSAFISGRGAFPPILRSPLFALHTVTAVLGYAAFAASAVYGVLFLLLYHELKKSHFGLVYERLPPLEVLARMSLGAVAFGLAFLTVTLLCGALWAASAFPGFTRDPKFLLTVAVWAVYLTTLLLHYGLHWTGRRTIRVSLLGFALLVFSFLAARLWFSSFHVFA
jgi:ABC-type uncharacterized transport system permease subunit